MSRDALDSTVESIEDLSSGTSLRDTHGSANASSNLGSGFHDHAKSFLESIPEAEVLEGGLVKVHHAHVSNLVAHLADLTPAVLGIEIVNGMRSGSPVLLVVVV